MPVSTQLCKAILCTLLDFLAPQQIIRNIDCGNNHRILPMLCMCEKLKPIRIFYDVSRAIIIRHEFSSTCHIDHTARYMTEELLNQPFDSPQAPAPIQFVKKSTRKLIASTSEKNLSNYKATLMTVDLDSWDTALLQLFYDCNQ